MSAYQLDRLILDLGRPDRRAAYLADAEAYASGYDLPDEERRLVLERDWNGLLDAGVSIYILTRLGEAHGLSLMDLGAAMRGTDGAGLAVFLADQNTRNAAHALLPEEDGSDG